MAGSLTLMYFTALTALGFVLSPILALTGATLGLLIPRGEAAMAAAAVVGACYAIAWLYLAWEDLAHPLWSPATGGLYFGATVACLVWVGLGRLLRLLVIKTTKAR